MILSQRSPLNQALLESSPREAFRPKEEGFLKPNIIKEGLWRISDDLVELLTFGGN